VARRTASRYDERVFINVPFDRRYQKLFDALVFAVHDCGFEARCALEDDDGSRIRLEKIYDIIEECRYGIHDLSRVTLDSAQRLPRFNMPLELGIFLAAKRFGPGQQRRKSGLILERELYRYQVYCSDIAGQDIRAHNNRADSAIVAVRNWLSGTRAGFSMIPSGQRMATRYLQFRLDLRRMCRDQHLAPSNLPFNDYRTLLLAWLDENEW
jgi:hypothetical protein